MPDGRIDPQARPFKLPIDPEGEPQPVFDPVIARKAVEREQVGIFKINRPGIFVGHFKIAQGRAGDDLEPRSQHLGAAKKLPDQWPFDVKRHRRDPAGLPAGIAAIAGRGGQRVFVRMIDIAPGQRGQADLLAPRCQTAQIPLRAGKGALAVLTGSPANRQRVDLQLEPSAQPGIGKAAAIVYFRQGERNLALRIADPQGLGRPPRDREIAVRIDLLQLHHRAQPIIPADIIAAQEGAI